MRKKLVAVLTGVIIFMLSTIPCMAFTAIQQGDNNETVAEVQQILIDLEYLSGSADGIFGSATAQAVQSYQTANNIEATGIVDENTYNALMASKSEAALANLPEGMSLDETEWENWEAENTCSLSAFMTSYENAGFTFSIPKGQKSDHKTVSFSFIDGDDTRSLENVEMYYCPIDQEVTYTGLWTEDESVFKSDDFREACIRLMLGYNIRYDSATKTFAPNMTRERAEEIVNYCLDNNIEHCLADDMRIRSTRSTEEGNSKYTFHMEI